MNYKHIYLEIIRKAKNEQILGNRPLNIYYRRRNFKDEYFEFHHILPKSLFPKFEKVKKNLVPLTAKEHFICHKLLFKIYPCKSTAYALLRLCRKRDDMHPIKLSARSYEQLRKILANTLSDAQKGKELSKETRIKISNALKEGYKSGKIIPPAKDKPVTAEKRKQISETLKERYKNGYKVWNKDKKCPNLVKRKEDSWNYGKHWYNNGEISILAETCPEGFKEGHIVKINEEIEEKRKIKITENNKGRHWYNNGKINKFCYECPEGFVKGFLDPRWIKNDDGNTR